jgi:hypothetical protein
VPSVSAYAGSAGSNNFTAGTVTWSNTGNATGAPDGTSSQCGGLSSGSETQSLDTYNFNPGLPAGATVTGLQIVVTASKQNSNRTITFTGGKLEIGSTTGTPTTTSANGTALTTSLTTYTYGSSTDLWGFSGGTLSVSNINSAVENTGPTFGVWFTAGAGASADEVNVDAVQLTVTYTPASSPNVSVTDSTTTANTPALMVDEDPNVSDSTTTADSVSVQLVTPTVVYPASDITTTGWSVSGASNFYTALDQTSFGSAYVYNSSAVSTDPLWLGTTFNSGLMGSIVSASYTVLWDNTNGSQGADFALSIYNSAQSTELASELVQIAAGAGDTTSSGTLTPQGGNFSTVSNWNNFTIQLKTGTVGGDTISGALFFGIAITIDYIPSLLSTVSDSTTTADSVFVVIADGPYVQDSTTTSDSVSLYIYFPLSVQDSTTTADAVVGNEGDLPPLNIEDGTTTADAVNVEIDYTISIGDATLTADFLGMQIPDTYVSVSDCTVTSDLAIQVSGIPPFVAVGDFTVTSDSIVATVSDLQISLSDSTATSDSVGSSLACLVAVSERTTTADVITATESVPNVEVFGVVDCVPSFKATVTTNPTYTATLMTNPLYVDNANDVTVTSFQQSNGTIINNAVLWVSLFDPSGTVVPGANTVQVVYQSGTLGNYLVTLPSSLGLTNNATYTRVVWSSNYQYYRQDSLPAIVRTGI